MELVRVAREEHDRAESLEMVRAERDDRRPEQFIQMMMLELARKPSA